MQPTVSYTHQQTRFDYLQSIVVKAAIPVCLLIYTCYQLSTGQLVFLALFSGLLLAIMNRIDNINSIDSEHHKRAANSTSFDGGTYNRKQSAKLDTPAAPAVNDGGSFARSSIHTRPQG